MKYDIMIYKVLKGEISMHESVYASLRYCSLLKRNVVFENHYDKLGNRESVCIYKSFCNYDECGCRNSLSVKILPSIVQQVEMKSSDV